MRQKYAEDMSGTKYSNNDNSNTNYYMNSQSQQHHNMKSHGQLAEKLKSTNDPVMSGGEGSEMFNMSSGSKVTNRIAAIKTKSSIKK